MEPPPDPTTLAPETSTAESLFGSSWGDSVFKWLLIAAACTIPLLLVALL